MAEKGEKEGIGVAWPLVIKKAVDGTRQQKIEPLPNHSPSSSLTHTVFKLRRGPSLITANSQDCVFYKGKSPVVGRGSRIDCLTFHSNTGVGFFLFFLLFPFSPLHPLVTFFCLFFLSFSCVCYARPSSFQSLLTR